MSETKAKDVVDIDCAIVRETEKAILVEIPTNATGWIKTEWFPLSQVESIHRTKEDGGENREHLSDKIVVKRWIAAKKGLVD